MRTTIDIPDNIFRRVKAAAALEGKSLKVFLTQALERELALRAAATPPRRRVSLPLVPSDRPGSVCLDSTDIAKALEGEDLDASAGH